MLISIELFGCFPFYLHSKRTIIGPVNELLLHFRYKWCSLLKIWPNIHCNIITPLDCCVWFKIHSSHINVLVCHQYIDFLYVTFDSVGHFNPDITLGCTLAGALLIPLAVCYFFAQILGGMLRAAFTRVCITK